MARASVFLIAAALIAGMIGCDGCGCNTPPSQNLEIRTWYDLDAVRNNLDGNHILMNDLNSNTAGYEELAGPTANGGKGWDPIGFWDPRYGMGDPTFSGTFDGQGYEIRDLFINRPNEDEVGLFGLVGHGVIKDIGVVNVTVIGNVAVGGLVGGGSESVSNSYSDGIVSGYRSVGGLAGHTNGSIINSYSTSNVTGVDNVGGLVGQNSGTVSNSYFIGKVTGVDNVGGLVGYSYCGTASNSYSTGSVSGDSSVGGLVGFISDGTTVSGSHSTANVTGKYSVGGLLGDTYSEVFDFIEINVSNSYYDYDEVLINGEKVISIGALPSEDFDQWLANNKFLDVNEKLSEEDGYYVVNNVTEFKELLAFGQNGSLKFRLKNDLNLGDEPNFYIPYLAGEFDGNGHRISNFSFNLDCVCYVGMFGYLARSGSITQMGVENINITGTGFVGGLVGENFGTVSDCYSTGSVTGKKWYVGGLVGKNMAGIISKCIVPGTVSNSYSTASVTGCDYVGGLVGLGSGPVNNSYSTGRVTGHEYVGGLVGWGGADNSYSTGSVTGEDGVGGLVGVGLASNSYYNYDEVLINGENIISIGALFGEDFNQWLTNDKFLDVNGRLSQEDGHYLINDVDDLKQLLAVGQNASLKFRLTNNLDLAAEPNFYIPYLAGQFDGNGHKISNLSFNFGFISNVGLFGFLAPGGKVTHVGAENVNITGYSYVGGLTGLNGGNVSNSYSTGNVRGEISSVGGLVGFNFGTIDSSCSNASVTGDEDVGGLVGKNHEAVSNSYSTGSVTGATYVGGLVGYNRGTVSNAYSTGSVTGATRVGGLVGRSGTVSNSFWDGQTSKRLASYGGTRKTTAEMKNIATFTGTGWNITAVVNPDMRNPSYIWNIVNGVTYPFLSWQAV